MLGHHLWDAVKELFLSVGIEPRAPFMLRTSYTTELRLQPHRTMF